MGNLDVVQAIDRPEAKARIQLCMDWLVAIDLLWAWGDRTNQIVMYAVEVLETARVISAVEPYETDEVAVLTCVDELERCCALVMQECMEWSALWTGMAR